MKNDIEIIEAVRKQRIEQENLRHSTALEEIEKEYGT